MERKAIQRKHEWQFRKQKFVKQYKMTSCTTRVKAKVQWKLGIKKCLNKFFIKKEVLEPLFIYC